MDYFIFKDIDSRSIPGLIVQELPSITKAPKRTDIIQIDGRDGDIVEVLGYNSYDKTIQIALTAGYNLNEIVNWLDGSGRLILSNEEDKYYTAEIIDQIDFERLAIFKTAIVRFHVQPYKHKVNEEVKTIILDGENVVNNEGFCKSKPIITIYGEGECGLYINNRLVCTVDIDEEYIVIDTEKQEAYKETILKNRYMQGDFDDIYLEPGENVIGYEGNVEKIEVLENARWL